MIRSVLRRIASRISGQVGFYVNLFPITRRLLNRIGPAVWRLPPDIRRRLCPETGVMRLPGVRLFRYARLERVRTPALPSGSVITSGHRIAARPYNVPQPFVAEVPAVWLVGQHATPVTSQGQILLSSFRDQAKLMTLERQDDLIDWIGSKSWKTQPSNPDHRHLCSFVNRVDSNYFHWITEWCSQVEGLRHYAEQTGVLPRLLIRAGGPRYQRESLELLGYSGADTVEWPCDARPALVQSYLLPSIPGVRVAGSPRSLQWLRKQFFIGAGVDDSDLKAHRRIYISRRPGAWRSAVNEAEVRECLEKEGFETLAAENLSLREQIQLFSETKIIVGLHGAGLINALFAPQAAVIELIGNYGGGEHYSLTTAFGQEYRNLRCESRENDDVYVDTSQLLKAVEKLAFHGVR